MKDHYHKKKLKVQKGKEIDENFWKEKEDIDKEIDRQRLKMNYFIEVLRKAH